jgi:hypothetical protein
MKKIPNMLTGGNIIVEGIILIMPPKLPDNLKSQGNTNLSG